MEKAGTWLRYGETQLGQGRERARQFLKENPDVAGELRQKILASREEVIVVDESLATEEAEEADGSEAEA